MRLTAALVLFLASCTSALAQLSTSTDTLVITGHGQSIAFSLPAQNTTLFGYPNPYENVGVLFNGMFQTDTVGVGMSPTMPIGVGTDWSFTPSAGIYTFINVIPGAHYPQIQLVPGTYQVTLQNLSPNSTLPAGTYSLIIVSND